MFSTNPARLNGLTGKGVIAPSFDADLVVLDPRTRRPARVTELHMPTDYTPYEGMQLTGWPAVVVAAGRVGLDEHGFHDPGPVGRPLHSQPMAEHLLT
jgi:dihydropyrimidinase